MRRSIIFLVSAIVIFVVTLVFTNRYMTEKATEEADRINQLQVEDVLQNMDSWLSIWEKSAQSFLVGRLDMGKISGNGSTTRLYIRNGEIPRLRASAYRDLHEFLHANPNVFSVSFLIEPSVYPERDGRGWGPTAKQDSTADFDLADRYDFVHSRSYERIRRDGKCVWHVPSRQSGSRGKIIMYYLPIYRQNGDFFGIFTINVGLTTLREKLRAALPYGEDGSSIIVMDKDSEIICSTHPYFEQFDNYGDLVRSLQKDYNTTSIHTEAKDYHLNMSDGIRYHVYFGRLGNVPWRTISVCSEECVYRGLSRSKNIILFVSLLGTILIFGCSYVIFREMRSSFIEKAEAEEELKMAAQVQMSILKTPKPHNLITLKPYNLNAFIRPAREAGGDLYDYTERDGRLVFCIGDVSGKGMPSALFMTQVVSLFRNAVSHQGEDIDPASIVSEINDVLSDNNPEMTFCTFFCGVIASGRLTFCNAGHNAPVMISDGSNPEFMQVKPNLALGLMSGFPYMSQSMTISDTDTLVMYTDGVTEAKNKKHELYGEGRLIEVLAEIPPDDTCEQINRRVLSSIEAFTRSARQSDDITLFTLKNS